MSDEWPRCFLVRQHLGGRIAEDPARRTAEALAALDLGPAVVAGQRVAVAVGSRGIADIRPIVVATVDHLRGLGLDPFVVAAMGSHGGGDAAGQRAVLAGYDLTEDVVGCPVRCEMDVVDLGRSALGFPLHFDRLAAQAEHVVLVNRVKPHTTFDGVVESGLAKMLCIGLGKREGAAAYHRAAFDHGWTRVITTAVPEVLARVSVLAGVAVIEDATERTARIEAVAGVEILEREPALLADARERMPTLPFDDVDILLIDQIGKAISGTGFDTNVVGRKGSVHGPSAERATRVGTIVLRGLAPDSGGNALGIGLAELCRTRVIEAMDPDVTGVNAVTSGNLAAAMVPVHRSTDRELLDACRTRTGLRDPADARICWIHSTLDLGVVACSEAYLGEADGRSDLTVLGDPEPLPFDRHGNLPDLLPPSVIEWNGLAHRPLPR